MEPKALMFDALARLVAGVRKFCEGSPQEAFEASLELRDSLGLLSLAADLEYDAELFNAAGDALGVDPAGALRAVDRLLRGRLGITK